MPKKGDIAYSTELELDLATVVPSVAGPKRPQDRIELSQLKEEFVRAFSKPVAENGFSKKAEDLTCAFPIGENGTTHAGGGTQVSVSPERAKRQDTNPLTEQEMAGNRPTPDLAGHSGSSPSGQIHHGDVLIEAGFGQ